MGFIYFIIGMIIIFILWQIALLIMDAREAQDINNDLLRSVIKELSKRKN